MSLAIFDDTYKNIHQAFQTNNLTEIGKETLFVFDRAVHAMLSHFKDRLKGITFESNDFNFNETYLRSRKNIKQMLDMLELLNQSNLPKSDFDLGKMKVDMEQWYYDMGGEGMYFDYHDAYLITPKEAAYSLGVSTVTLNKYVKQLIQPPIIRSLNML